MKGAAKALFVPMALSVGFSMIAAYLLSSTLVPVLAVWIVRGHRKEEIATATAHALGVRAVQAATPACCAGWSRRAGSWPSSIWRRRWASCGCSAAGWGWRFFPKVDAGQIAIRFRAPAGTKLDSTEAIGKKILDLVGKEVGRPTSPSPSASSAFTRRTIPST